MSELCGIFNIDKPAGWTSFDVVAKMRGLCHTKKIGHTGTLDPAATGVLPICVGRATKVAELLTDGQKTYRAVMRLGAVSDTQDAQGHIRITATASELAALTSEQIGEAAAFFEGGYEQVPPMYSAKHHEGKRLYELAREGRTVQRDPVPVHIDHIQIEWQEQERGTAVLTVTCGKGTYIRTLIADIGERLGCGALMESLCRLQVGQFKLEKAYSLETLQEMADAGRLTDALMPLDQVFGDRPKAVVDLSFEKMALNGNPLPEKAVSADPALSEVTAEGSLIRLYTQQGVLIGLYRIDRDELRPVKMLSI